MRAPRPFHPRAARRFAGCAVLVPVATMMLVAATLLAGSMPVSAASRAERPLAGMDATPTPPIATAMSEIVWVNAHASNACPGSPIRGGEATGGPDGFETWCFEGGPGDSTSSAGGAPWTFRSFDARTLRDDNDSLYWHADTWQAIAGVSMWCGGWNDRTGSWTAAGSGYGNHWQQIMQLTLPGPLNAANGCSIQFKARYTLECNYDYTYLEYWSIRRGQWQVIDRFNGKSGCTVLIPEGSCRGDWNNYWRHSYCPGNAYGSAVSFPGAWRGSGSAPRDFPGYPYVSGNAWVLLRGDSISATPASVPEIRLRWRVSTDRAVSSADGTTSVHGFWVDDVRVKVGGFAHFENFDALASGSLPGMPYSFPRLEPVYDGWAIRYDLDPPFEGLLAAEPGDDGIPGACWANASWQWSIVAEPGPIPPPPAGSHVPGYRVFLTTPAIPLDYADEEGGGFARPGVTVQHDFYSEDGAETCDRSRMWVRTHQETGIGPWTATGAWGPWRLVDGFETYGGGTSFGKDVPTPLVSFSTLPGIDSIQVAWVSEDQGAPGMSCWDPALPPHLDTQYVVDNVSVGLFDAGTPDVHANAWTGRFQDTFNTRSCLHTAMVPTVALYGTYTLADGGESLSVGILDPDGLDAGDVLLHWSHDRFASEAPGSPLAMRLSEPDIISPTRGGTWRGTICDTPWTAGTEVSYYLSVHDRGGHVAYVPASAAPSASPREFWSVDILPTPGARILLVDDAEETTPQYHPCRQDTVLRDVGEASASLLAGLGFGFMQPGGFDIYDVNAPNGPQRINEPWGFWTATPSAPDSGARAYDVVVWTTGRRTFHTIQDTSQTWLKQFVFHGGKVLVTGDAIGRDLADPAVPEDPDFYGNLLGAAWLGEHGGVFTDPDRFPKKAAGAPGTTLAPGDSLHLYAGCDEPRWPMDRIRAKTSGLPAWSHPVAWLRYEDATTPFDSLAGMVNFTTVTADTGRIVYMPFSLDAVVDRHRVGCDPPYSPFEDVGFGDFAGQAEILKEVLEIFGAAPRTGVGGGGASSAMLHDALHAVSPNPLRSEGWLRFTIAASGPVSLTLYDVSGRRVAMLLDRVLEAGEHAVRWSGREASGREAAAGIYFARLATPRAERTEKLLLVR